MMSFPPKVCETLDPCSRTFWNSVLAAPVKCRINPQSRTNILYNKPVIELRCTLIKPEMSPKTGVNDPEAKWIHHSSHTKHPLKEVYKNTKFDCKACKTEGRGPRYRCEPCDINIHPTCGTCPESLTCFAHPKHTLYLTEHSFLSHPKCKLCLKHIHGIVYRCRECSFNMHPLCTQMPEVLTGHAIHPPHTITLQSMKSKTCDVCEESCKHWRYHCAACEVHIHVGCLSKKTKGESNSDEGGFGNFLGQFTVGVFTAFANSG